MTKMVIRGRSYCKPDRLAPIIAGEDKPLKKDHWGVTSLSASNWIPCDRQGSEDLLRSTDSMSS